MSCKDPENTFSVLIATDNHLGYMEKDPVRKNDSFQTFEEILTIAETNKVDFVLLGGDLFHDNKPSRYTLCRTMDILRRKCMGDRKCQFRILSDRSQNFCHNYGTANFESENFRIALPIFSIHGNHDDPNGESNLSALEILEIAGLLNYYGKHTTVADITVTPILLQKGHSRLALYGLGNLRDERLYSLFRNNKVKFLRPKEDPGSWFNLLSIHQNRVAHGPKSHIPEKFLDSFVDFVLWGHEHECCIDPQQNEEQEFTISQPGSSVATSLSPGEAKQKHVALLQINGKTCRFKKVRLKTVRPFARRDITLTDVKPESREQVGVYLTDQINSLIEEARDEYARRNGLEPAETDPESIPRPLIRLKVEYEGDLSTLNPHRFSQQFVSQVANAKDMLHFQRKRSSIRRSFSTGEVDAKELFPDNPTDSKTVQDFISQFVREESFVLLPPNGLHEAVKLFVDKDDRDALDAFCTNCLSKTQKACIEKCPNSLTETIKAEASLQKNQLASQVSKHASALEIYMRESNLNLSDSAVDSGEGSERENESSAPTKRTPRRTPSTGKRTGSSISGSVRKRAHV